MLTVCSCKVLAGMQHCEKKCFLLEQASCSLNENAHLHSVRLYVQTLICQVANAYAYAEYAYARAQLMFWNVPTGLMWQ